jgi:hypothetical protein
MLFKVRVNAVADGIGDEVPFASREIPIPKPFLDTRRTIAREKPFDKG